MFMAIIFIVMFFIFYFLDKNKSIEVSKINNKNIYIIGVILVSLSSLFLIKLSFNYQNNILKIFLMSFETILFLIIGILFKDKIKIRNIFTLLSSILFLITLILLGYYKLLGDKFSLFGIYKNYFLSFSFLLFFLVICVRSKLINSNKYLLHFISLFLSMFYLCYELSNSFVFAISCLTLFLLFLNIYKNSILSDTKSFDLFNKISIFVYSGIYMYELFTVKDSFTIIQKLPIFILLISLLINFIYTFKNLNYSAFYTSIILIFTSNLLNLNISKYILIYLICIISFIISYLIKNNKDKNLYFYFNNIISILLLIILLHEKVIILSIIICIMQLIFTLFYKKDKVLLNVLRIIYYIFLLIFVSYLNISYALQGVMVLILILIYIYNKKPIFLLLTYFPLVLIIRDLPFLDVYKHDIYLLLLIPYIFIFSRKIVMKEKDDNKLSLINFIELYMIVTSLLFIKNEFIMALYLLILFIVCIIFKFDLILKVFSILLFIMLNKISNSYYIIIFLLFILIINVILYLLYSNKKSNIVFNIFNLLLSVIIMFKICDKLTFNPLIIALVSITIIFMLYMLFEDKKIRYIILILLFYPINILLRGLNISYEFWIWIYSLIIGIVIILFSLLKDRKK